MKNTAEIKAKFFKSAKAFNLWLETNHAKSDGLWIKFFKKASGVKGMVYAEAVDEALCFGWIDSQSKGINEQYYIQKFTPRRSRSVWSQVNRKKIARLIKEGRMKPAGLVQVKAAKKDGRWANAYGGLSTFAVPEDFINAIKQYPKAFKFFKTLNRSTLYTIYYQLTAAKKIETRNRRIEKFIDLFAKGQKPGY